MMTSFLTLVEREFYRFMRLFNQTVLPPLITTVMYILIFGYSLGSRIQEIHGFPYIIFIIPGLVQLGVITNSYANSSTSLYMARLERSIENMLVAPIPFLQIVLSFIIGALLRGMVVGLAIFCSARLFVPIPMTHPALFFLVLFLTSLIFGALGIISAIQAESWERMATFTNFVITPFVYLGGTFYSVDLLPEFWRKVSLVNPIFYAIDLFRYACLGVGDMPINISLALLSLSAIVLISICVLLFHRGYKIIK